MNTHRALISRLSNTCFSGKKSHILTTIIFLSDDGEKVAGAVLNISNLYVPWFSHLLIL